MLGDQFSQKDLILGHGSFFDGSKSDPSDIDVTVILDNLGHQFHKRVGQLDLFKIDITTISIEKVYHRIRLEAASGYQFLARSICNGVLISGNEQVLALLAELADSFIEQGPRAYAKDAMTYHVNAIYSALDDVARLDASYRNHLLASSFMSLIRLSFYNRNEWYCGASYSKY